MSANNNSPVVTPEFAAQVGQTSFDRLVNPTQKQYVPVSESAIAQIDGAGITAAEANGIPYENTNISPEALQLTKEARELPPEALRAKYGPVADRILSKFNQDALAYIQSKQIQQSPTEQVAGGASSLISSALDMVGLGADAVTAAGETAYNAMTGKQGYSATRAMNNLRESISNAIKSAGQGDARRAMEFADQADRQAKELDNERRYQEDLKNGESPFTSGLAYFARGVQNGVSEAFRHPGETIGEGLGSLYGFSLLARGAAKGIGKIVGDSAGITRSGLEVATEADKSARWQKAYAKAEANAIKETENNAVKLAENKLHTDIEKSFESQLEQKIAQNPAAIARIQQLSEAEQIKAKEEIFATGKSNLLPELGSFTPFENKTAKEFEKAQLKNLRETDALKQLKEHAVNNEKQNIANKAQIEAIKDIDKQNSRRWGALVSAINAGEVGGEGVMNALAELDSYTDEEIKNSDIGGALYKDFIAQGYSPDEAIKLTRQKLESDLIPSGAVSGALSGASSGWLVAKIVKNPFAIAKGSSLLGNTFREMGEETWEAVNPDIAINAAIQRNLDSNRSLFKGVGEDVGQSATSAGLATFMSQGPHAAYRSTARLFTGKEQPAQAQATQQTQQTQQEQQASTSTASQQQQQPQSSEEQAKAKAQAEQERNQAVTDLSSKNIDTEAAKAFNVAVQQHVAQSTPEKGKEKEYNEEREKQLNSFARGISSTQLSSGLQQLAKDELAKKPEEQDNVVKDYLAKVNPKDLQKDIDFLVNNNVASLKDSKTDTSNFTAFDVLQITDDALRDEPDSLSPDQEKLYKTLDEIHSRYRDMLSMDTSEVKDSNTKAKLNLAQRWVEQHSGVTEKALNRRTEDFRKIREASAKIEEELNTTQNEIDVSKNQDLRNSLDVSLRIASDSLDAFRRSTATDDKGNTKEEIFSRELNEISSFISTITKAIKQGRLAATSSEDRAKLKHIDMLNTVLNDYKSILKLGNKYKETHSDYAKSVQGQKVGNPALLSTMPDANNKPSIAVHMTRMLRHAMSGNTEAFDEAARHFKHFISTQARKLEDMQSAYDRYRKDKSPNKDTKVYTGTHGISYVSGNNPEAARELANLEAYELAFMMNAYNRMLAEMHNVNTNDYFYLGNFGARIWKGKDGKFHYFSRGKNGKTITDRLLSPAYTRKREKGEKDKKGVKPKIITPSILDKNAINALLGAQSVAVNAKHQPGNFKIFLDRSAYTAEQLAKAKQQNKSSEEGENEEGENTPEGPDISARISNVALDSDFLDGDALVQAAYEAESNGEDLDIDIQQFDENQQLEDEGETASLDEDNPAAPSSDPNVSSAPTLNPSETHEENPSSSNSDESGWVFDTSNILPLEMAEDPDQLGDIPLDEEVLKRDERNILLENKSAAAINTLLQDNFGWDNIAREDVLNFIEEDDRALLSQIQERKNKEDIEPEPEGRLQRFFHWLWKRFKQSEKGKDFIENYDLGELAKNLTEDQKKILHQILANKIAGNNNKNIDDQQPNMIELMNVRLNKRLRRAWGKFITSNAVKPLLETVAQNPDENLRKEALDKLIQHIHSYDFDGLAVLVKPASVDTLLADLRKNPNTCPVTIDSKFAEIASLCYFEQLYKYRNRALNEIDFESDYWKDTILSGKDKVELNAQYRGTINPDDLVNDSSRLFMRVLGISKQGPTTNKEGDGLIKGLFQAFNSELYDGKVDRDNYTKDGSISEKTQINQIGLFTVVKCPTPENFKDSFQNRRAKDKYKTKNHICFDLRNSPNLERKARFDYLLKDETNYDYSVVEKLFNLTPDSGIHVTPEAKAEAEDKDISKAGKRLNGKDDVSDRQAEVCLSRNKKKYHFNLPMRRLFNQVVNDDVLNYYRTGYTVTEVTKYLHASDYYADINSLEKNKRENPRWKEEFEGISKQELDGILNQFNLSYAHSIASKQSITTVGAEHMTLVLRDMMDAYNKTATTPVTDQYEFLKILEKDKELEDKFSQQYTYQMSISNRLVGTNVTAYPTSHKIVREQLTLFTPKEVRGASAEELFSTDAKVQEETLGFKPEQIRKTGWLLSLA